MEVNLLARSRQRAEGGGPVQPLPRRPLLRSVATWFASAALATQCLASLAAAELSLKLPSSPSTPSPPRFAAAADGPAAAFVNNDVSAPHVKIGESTFYGGVETVFYTGMDAPVCRLASVCVTEDQTVVLPRWMRRHDDLLRYQCGLESLSFTLPDQQPPPRYAGNVDLFGLSALRHHMPHFVRDIVPSLLAFDAAFGARTHTGVSRSCHTRAGVGCDKWPLVDWAAMNLSGLTPGGGSGGLYQVSPAVMALPRMRLLDKKAWVREFLRLLPPRVEGEAKDARSRSGPIVLYPGDLFGPEAEEGASSGPDNALTAEGAATTSRQLAVAEVGSEADAALAGGKDAGSQHRKRPVSWVSLLHSLARQAVGGRGDHVKMACFRSATVGTIRKRRGHRQKTMSDETLNQLVLYTANDLIKAPRTPLLGRPVAGGSRPTCKLRVTILNRVAPPQEQLAKAKDPFAFGRHIPRVGDVRKAILAAASSDSQLDLTLDIRLRYFEGMTLDEQVAVMQATDLLVGAHGAGLANALFMRTNSSLVELAPFAYYATVFEELSLTQASLRYSRFIAKPDDAQFSACMAHHHPPSVGPSVMAASDELVKRFKKAANAFRDSLGGNTHALQLHTDSKADFWARVCARSQSLRVDAKQLAKSVVEAAVLQCLAAPGNVRVQDKAGDPA